MIQRSNTFVKDIENLCTVNKVEYIDAVVMWCEKNKIEVEIAAAWIKKDPTLKAKLQAEAESLNILKRGARLPI